MMRNRSWLAHLARKLFPRRSFSANRAARQRSVSSMDSLRVPRLVSETLEPRHLLDGAGLDFADAPASYPVTLADDGARHDESTVTWQQLGDTIVGEGGGDQAHYPPQNSYQRQFGDAIALSEDGSTIAIGARGNNGNGSDSGHTRIYRWDGAAWNQLGSDIDGEAAGDHSGKDVTLSGDGNTVVIGAEENDGTANRAGHARVYRWDGSSWNQLGNDFDGEEANDFTGCSVSISSDGNIIAVGSTNNPADGDWAYSGDTRIYHWDGTTWNQLGSSLGGDHAYKGKGCTVSLSDDGFTVAIGEPDTRVELPDGTQGSGNGQTRIYRWDGGVWNQLGDTIQGEEGASGAAISLSSDGEVVAIGDTHDWGDTSTRGHTRIYRWDGGAWNQLGSVLIGEANEDQSAVAVSLSGDATTLVIGAWGNDANGNNAGHARIYRYDGSDWQQSGSDIDGGAAGDQFGSYVAISGDSRTVAVGATQVETTKKGYTRVYRSDTAPWLGLTRDSESDGTPSASADGDGADEDGVVFSNLYAGSTASIDVTVSGNNGLLDGWFDFNADGDWEDAGEQVFASTSVDVGQNNLSVAIPAGAASGTTFARFRLSSDGGLQSTGLAADGEVEDYSVSLSEANQAPVATDNNYSIEADGVLTVGASGILADDTDANGDVLSAVLVSDVSDGVLSLSNDGSFTYAPNEGYYGNDSFTYRASDGEETSNLATVTIEVVSPATLSIEATQQGSEADASATLFTLTRTGDTTAPLDAHVILQGTALPGVDYTAPAGLGENNTLTVTFDAGSDTATLSLPTLSDNVIDSYETVLAMLQPGIYSVQPGADRAVGVIVGEDVEVSPEHFVAFDAPLYNTATLSNGVFAMLRNDGSIATWGDSTADEYSELTAGTPTGGGFTQLYSNAYAFAALHADGSVATWGRSDAGGDPGASYSSAMAADVLHIIPKNDGFTAIKADGQVITWGDTYFWGGGYAPPAQIDNIAKMCSTWMAFAALIDDGTIETWGEGSYGGGADPFSAPPSGDGFVDVVAGFHHFAALREDGTIVVWGGTFQSPWAGAKLNAPTDDGYIQIVANGDLSFAALKADGSITIWGNQNISPPGNGYTQIIPGGESFAAIHADGSIYSSLSGSPSGNDFTQVIANTEAYAAIKADGAVVTWGNFANGGDSASVAENLVGVVEIAQTDRAFAALRVDGTVVTWGNANYGGDSSSVASNLTNVTHLYAIDNAFAARRADGSVVSWGAAGNLTSIPTETGLVAHATPKWNDRLTFDSFLSLSTNEISEGAGPGAATGTVTRSGDLSGDLVVSLQSSDTSEATVPASVTIAAGQASASFPIDAVDDVLGDLSQPVTITAQVADTYYGRAVLNVVDDGDEGGALFIDDGDAGYSTNVSPITVTDQGYQNDYQWILATTPDSPYYIEYEASDIGAGNYEIATTWQTQTEVPSFARHTAVQYEIYDGQTLVDTVTVNQQQAPAADYTAGGESFEIIAPDISLASDTLRVRILIQTPGTGASYYRTLSADAVRFGLAAVNDPPIFADQTMGVAKGSADGTLVGTLTATDPEDDSPHLRAHCERRSRWGRDGCLPR